VEDGLVTVARVRGTLELPARFQLVAAMNPCPCGSLGDPGRACRCPPATVLTYQRRISGPLLDRIDLHVEVPALPVADLEGPPGESSERVAARVARARDLQAARHSMTNATTNARLDPAALRAAAPLDEGGRRLLRSAMERLRLSGRSHDRLLRVARTLADLDSEADVGGRHVSEALLFRAVPISE